MRRLSKHELAAGAIASLLGLLAAWQAFAPVSASHRRSLATQPAAILPTPASGPQTQPIARAAFAEVEERPLFLPGRRPAAVVAAHAAPVVQTQSLDPYTIIGIIVAPERAVALLRGPSGNPIHLHQGQALAGWTLETIAKNRLVFAAGEQHQELTFKTNKSQQGQNGPQPAVGIGPPNMAASPQIPGMPSR